LFDLNRLRDALSAYRQAQALDPSVGEIESKIRLVNAALTRVAPVVSKPKPKPKPIASKPKPKQVAVKENSPQKPVVLANSNPVETTVAKVEAKRKYRNEPVAPGVTF